MKLLNRGGLMMERMRQYHVGVAAEAFAAGLFAQAGCDVLVQYGANQPLYDLMIKRGDRAIPVSVKGSQDGGWGLMQSFKRGRQYYEAADAWVESHRNQDIVYCLVQFQDVALGECPRVYLATIAEIASRHKESRNGFGETILWENRCYKKGIAQGCTDMIPSHWRFSQERLGEFLPREDSSREPFFPTDSHLGSDCKDVGRPGGAETSR